MADATMRIFRGGPEGAKPVDSSVTVAPGMVVLDALHASQEGQATDLAVQGGPLRLLLGRGQRPPAADL